MPLVMVFIDGLGLGVNDPGVNPLAAAEMPFFRRLLAGLPLTAETVGIGLKAPELVINPTDASLNTPGLPQSATGQTAIFTGINAARIAGRHVNGFPTKALREVLRSHSIFKIISQAGQRGVFANTFTDQYFETVERGKWRHSVTTTAALAGGRRLLMVPDLIRGEAVYQDITGEMLREKGYDIAIVTPEEAAAHLLKQAAQNDFTLFEYFQTDHCGHSQDYQLALALLNRLDHFLGTIAGHLAADGLDLLVVSDHGNIEDLTVKTHTFNQVPTIGIGAKIRPFESIRSLTDIYPAVLEYLGIKNNEQVLNCRLN